MSRNIVKTEEFLDADSEDDDTTLYYDLEAEMNDKEASTKIEYVSIENDEKKSVESFVENDKKDVKTIIENINEMPTETTDDVLNAPKIIVFVPRDQPIKKIAKPSPKLPTEKRTKRSYRKKADRIDSELICRICGSEYKFIQDLDRHIKRHSNDKQFMCS